MLASRRNGTLYIGVTADLVRRVSHHRAGAFCGFTARYQVHRLVWYEAYATIQAAIAREKAMKEWHRAWKIRLIEATNPHWADLATGFEFARWSRRNNRHPRTTGASPCGRDRESENTCAA